MEDHDTAGFTCRDINSVIKDVIAGIQIYRRSGYGGTRACDTRGNNRVTVIALNQIVRNGNPEIGIFDRCVVAAGIDDAATAISAPVAPDRNGHISISCCLVGHREQTTSDRRILQECPLNTGIQVSIDIDIAAGINAVIGYHHLGHDRHKTGAFHRHTQHAVIGVGIGVAVPEGGHSSCAACSSTDCCLADTGIDTGNAGAASTVEIEAMRPVLTGIMEREIAFCRSRPCCIHASTRRGGHHAHKTGTCNYRDTCHALEFFEAAHYLIP